MATAFSENNVERNAKLYSLTISPYNNAIQKDYEMAGDITIANSLSTESRVQNHNIIKTINYVKNQSNIIKKSTPSSRVLILRKSQKKNCTNLSTTAQEFNDANKSHNNTAQNCPNPFIRDLSSPHNPAAEYDDVSTSSAESGSPSYDFSPESSVDSQPRQYDNLWKSADFRQNLLQDRLSGLLVRARKLKDHKPSSIDTSQCVPLASTKDSTVQHRLLDENDQFIYEQPMDSPGLIDVGNDKCIEMHHISALNGPLDYDITDQINGIQSSPTKQSETLRNDVKWVPQKEVSNAKMNNINHKIAVLERLANNGETSLSFSNRRKSIYSNIAGQSKALDININAETRRLLRNQKIKRALKSNNLQTNHQSNGVHRSICHCGSGNKCRYCTPLFSPKNKRKSSLDLQTDLDSDPRLSYIIDDHAYSMKTVYQTDDSLPLKTHDTNDLHSSSLDSGSTYKFKKSKRSSGSHIKKNKKKKPENDFDIDNVMIPICFNTKVEKPKFKQIVTPKWRIIDDEPTMSHSGTPSFDFINAELQKDTEDDEITRRHANSEIIEKRRFTAFQSACMKPRRTRSDSCCIIPSPLGSLISSPTSYTPPKRILRSANSSLSTPFIPRIFPITSKEFSKAVKNNVLPLKHKSNRSLLLKQQQLSFPPPSCSDHPSLLYNDKEDDYIDIMHSDASDPEWHINNSEQSHNIDNNFNDSGIVLKLSRKA